MFKFNFQDIKSRFRALRLRLPDLHSPDGRRYATIVGAITLVLLFAIGYGFQYTSQSRFCENCHELQPAINAWKTSLHAEVECNVCHAPGVVGQLQQKASLVVGTYRHFTKSYKQPINESSEVSKNIDNDSCLKCHTPKRIITPRKTIIMNHNIHLEKGVSCTTCHNRAGHPSSTEYKSFISMDGCFRCHGLSTTSLAPGRCDACHPKSFDLVPVTHKTGSWRIPDHGKVAKRDVDPCLTCHQKTFCQGCHGVEMPHPDKFVKAEHGSIGRKNPQVCQKCHRQNDFCNVCHHKGYDDTKGGWIPAHKFSVAVVGPANCFSCHGPTFCAVCHVRGEVKPRTKRQ